MLLKIVANRPGEIDAELDTEDPSLGGDSFIYAES